MKDLKNNISKSALAGIFISDGCCVYLMCPNKIVGAILFSVALMAICTMKANLFTGKVGFLWLSNDVDDFIVNTKNLAVMLLTNLLATMLIASLMRVNDDMRIAANAICANKISQTPKETFIKAISCGVLMYTAVRIYNTNSQNKYIGILFCVPVFIISGFEHCIADWFYLFVSDVSASNSIMYTVNVIVGNSVGSLITCALDEA